MQNLTDFNHVELSDERNQFAFLPNQCYIEVTTYIPFVVLENCYTVMYRAEYTIPFFSLSSLKQTGV